MLCINFTKFCQHYHAIISKKTGGSTYLVHVSTRYGTFTKSLNRGETSKNYCQKNIFMSKQLREQHRRMQDWDFPKYLSRREESTEHSTLQDQLHHKQSWCNIGIKTESGFNTIRKPSEKKVTESFHDSVKEKFWLESAQLQKSAWSKCFVFFRISHTRSGGTSAAQCLAKKKGWVSKNPGLDSAHSVNPEWLHR